MEQTSPQSTEALQRDRRLQARTPDPPEVLSSSSPEVVASDTPEAVQAHSAPPRRTLPHRDPELYYFDGLYTVEDRVPPPTQADIPPPTQADIPPAKEHISQRKRWRVIMLFAVIVIVAAVVGGVGGTLGRRSTSSTQTSTVSIPPTSSQSTTLPSSQSPPSPQSANSTDGMSDLSRVVLRNTSIASATCLNGDRWVFLQDTNGNIRGAQYSLSASTWSITSNQTIEADAKIGTPLSASCVDIPASVAAGSQFLPPGLLISLIYLNASNALHQSLYSEGAWRHTQFYTVTIPPANTTKLAIASTVVPALPVGNVTKASYFSSVAVYQSGNGTFVMIDLFPQGQPTSPNLFSQFQGMNIPNENSSPDIGVCLSCIHKAQAPTISSQLFTQCVLAYWTEAWVYNQTLNNSDQTFHQGSGEAHSYWNTSLTDVALAYLSQGNVATVYLAGPRNNLITTLIEPVQLPTEGNDASWDTPIPYPRIGATALAGNSSVFYVHFQVNDTAVGEISFDAKGGGWGKVAGGFVVR